MKDKNKILLLCWSFISLYWSLIGLLCALCVFIILPIFGSVVAYISAFSGGICIGRITEEYEKYLKIKEAKWKSQN
jgi:hypothetical protein